MLKSRAVVAREPVLDGAALMSETKISRKQFLKLGAAGLSAAALGGVAPSISRAAGKSAESSDRPNILFITVDQLRSFADVPNQLPLPTFRRFAKEGRNFTNYHVHQAPCGPSRSVIYTGQYVQKTGMYTNPPGEYAELGTDLSKALQLSTDFPTVGKMLREQGYYTAYKGKWHLSLVDQIVKAKTGRGFPDTSNSLEEYGFSDYNLDGEHSGMTWVGFGHDGFIAADAVELLNEFTKGKTGGKPWFFAVNFVNPHDIMFYEPPYAEAGKGNARGAIGSLKEPPLVGPYRKVWNLPLPKSLYEDNLSTKPGVQRSLVRTGSLDKVSAEDEAAWQTYQDYYLNCIRDVDTHIATVLAALDRFGLADNTIVFLTSDHGEMAGAHHLKGKGAYIYKECVRVPLVIRHPRVRGGKATGALAGSVDLTPTILAYAGLSDAERVAKYPYLRGVDVQAAVADASARTDRDQRGILFDYMTPGFLRSSEPLTADKRRGLIRGVFDGRYKFGRYFRVTEHHIPTDWETLIAHNDLELYDTQADPDEIVNLAYRPEEHRDLILALNAKVNNLIENEIGADDGSIYPGPTAQYVLKTPG
jgi:arylsulfatase A-like enzyme